MSVFGFMLSSIRYIFRTRRLFDYLQGAGKTACDHELAVKAHEFAFVDIGRIVRPTPQSEG